MAEPRFRRAKAAEEDLKVQFDGVHAPQPILDKSVVSPDWEGPFPDVVEDALAEFDRVSKRQIALVNPEMNVTFGASPALRAMVGRLLVDLGVQGTLKAIAHGKQYAEHLMREPDAI